MAELLPINLFIKQALLYPLVAPFLPTANKVLKDFSYAAGRLIGTLPAGEGLTMNLDFCIIAPDLVATEHDDDICIFHVDPVKYPYGIEVTDVEVTLRVNANYTLVFEEWRSNTPDAPTFLTNLKTVILTNQGHKKISGGDISNSEIVAGNYIFVRLPTTNIPWVAGKVIFYAKTS